MLIDLTTKCSMGCSHCMSSCTASGVDMTPDMLVRILDYCDKWKVQITGYSGGEMFENEHIIQLLDIIDDYYSKHKKQLITFITNGWQLSSDFDIYERVVALKQKYGKFLMIQVTSDDRYYPKKLDEKQLYRLKKLKCIIDTVPNGKNGKPSIYPLGRAKDNIPPEDWDIYATKCANVRLVAKQKNVKDIGQLTKAMIEVGRLCTPIIRPDGKISIGESFLCRIAGDINTPQDELINSIIYGECSGCQEVKEVMKENGTQFMMDLIIGRRE